MPERSSANEINKKTANRQQKDNQQTGHTYRQATPTDRPHLQTQMRRSSIKGRSQGYILQQVEAVDSFLSLTSWRPF